MQHPPTDALLDKVQRATISYFWEGAHPESGMAYDHRLTYGEPKNDLVAIGGSGFGFLAIIVGVSRGWIGRDAAVERLAGMMDFIARMPRFHGAFPHMADGKFGRAVPFSRFDDGADIVETALLAQGLICTRQYFDGSNPSETSLRTRIQDIIDAVEWDWFAKGPSGALFWHWSPEHHWKIGLPITGWNEGMVAYVLAAGSRNHRIDASSYHNGWARDGRMRNGESYYGHQLPLGPTLGGPLYFASTSFSALDPRRLADRYCAYWEQNRAHALINRAYCVDNPNGFQGYGTNCWGLSASHGPNGYVTCSPTHDLGYIAPSAAMSVYPYVPEASEKALRHYLHGYDGRLWGRFGLVDAFGPDGSWIARTYLAINQGTTVAMLENHRTGLLWDLFMAAPEVVRGLRELGISIHRRQKAP